MPDMSSFYFVEIGKLKLENCDWHISLYHYARWWQQGDKHI